MRREPVHRWLWRHVAQRLPEGPTVQGRVNWRKWRGYAIITSVLVLLVLSLAGIIAGAGFFLLSMIAMNYLYVAGSSLLLAISATALAAGYLWFEPQ